MTPTDFREIRTHLGLYQSQLAVVLGYRQQHLSGLEQGHKPIQPVTAIAMRAMLAMGLPETWAAV